MEKINQIEKDFKQSFVDASDNDLPAAIVAIVKDIDTRLASGHAYWIALAIKIMRSNVLETLDRNVYNDIIAIYMFCVELDAITALRR